MRGSTWTPTEHGARVLNAVVSLAAALRTGLDPLDLDHLPQEQRDWLVAAGYVTDQGFGRYQPRARREDYVYVPTRPQDTAFWQADIWQAEGQGDLGAGHGPAIARLGRVDDFEAAGDGLVLTTFLDGGVCTAERHTPAPAALLHLGGLSGFCPDPFGPVTFRGVLTRALVYPTGRAARIVGACEGGPGCPDPWPAPHQLTDQEQPPVDLATQPVAVHVQLSPRFLPPLPEPDPATEGEAPEGPQETY